MQYVHAQEHHPDHRKQFIASYRTMWMVDNTKEFFHRGIVTKTSSFKKWAILPEFRVVSSDIKTYPDIYRMFQFHKFEWMDSAPGDFFNHLTKDFMHHMQRQ